MFFLTFKKLKESVQKYSSLSWLYYCNSTTALDVIRIKFKPIARGQLLNGDTMARDHGRRPVYYTRNLIVSVDMDDCTLSNYYCPMYVWSWFNYRFVSYRMENLRPKLVNSSSEEFASTTAVAIGDWEYLGWRLILDMDEPPYLATRWLCNQWSEILLKQRFPQGQLHHLYIVCIGTIHIGAARIPSAIREGSREYPCIGILLYIKNQQF